MLNINITALSFSVGSIFAAVIAWRSFYIWERKKDNEVSKSFFYALILASLYMGSRGIASFFFFDSPGILTFSYIVSHVFLGGSASFLTRFTVASFFKISTADKFFWLVIILFCPNIILNIIFPNSPIFNQEMNIIEWGTNHYVAIYHSVLLFAVFGGITFLFIAKAIQNWNDYEVRTRSLVIAFACLSGILLVIPRNIFQTPIFILTSDLGYILSLAIMYLGVGSGFQKKN